MSGTVEFNDEDITLKLVGGGRIIMGLFGVGGSSSAALASPLTPDELVYGRGLCLLPIGWEDLSGDESWQGHLSKELRIQWPTLTREQKMAIAHTMSELSDELINSAYEYA